MTLRQAQGGALRPGNRTDLGSGTALRQAQGGARSLVAFFLLLVAVSGHARASDDLVTPIRIGREDAPLVISMWAQQEYSHLAARQDAAAVFHQIFRDWAVAHPDANSRS